MPAPVPKPPAEYYCHFFTHPRTVNPSSLQDEINEIAKKGWEIVSTAMSQHGSGGAFNVLIVFKKT